MGGKLSKQELYGALETDLANADVSFLAKSDEDDALDVFANAFKEDKMFTWVAQLDNDDPNRDQKMLTLSRNLHVYANHRLIVRTRGVALEVRDRNNDLVGCMAIAPSSCANERMIDSIAAWRIGGWPPMYKSKAEYGPFARQRLEKLQMLKGLRNKHMKDTKKWIYLQTIGVHPDQHGKGYGKKMLQLLNQTADSLNVPIYLETDTPKNESMYKHFGYATVEELNMCVPGDTSPTANFKGYLMRRNPK